MPPALPSGAGGPPPSTATGAIGSGPLAGTPAPRGAKRRAIVVAVVVVLVIAAGIGAYVYLGGVPNVDVNTFIATSPGNTCGLGASPVVYPGFNDTPGNVDEFEFVAYNYNLTGACTVNGVTTNTSGFGISGASVPLTVPAGSLTGPGQTNLWLNLTLPGSSWSGNVYLLFT